MSRHCSLLLICLTLLVSLQSFSLGCLDEDPVGPKGSGSSVTGGWGKKVYVWRIFNDTLEDLKAVLHKGNVYVKLRGEGTIAAETEKIGPIGPNTTIDGRGARITITGPKGIWINGKGHNIAIFGLCFKNNDNAVNMPNGGSRLWVHQNTFLNSSYGSAVAPRGYGNGQGNHTGSITISYNWFGPTHYGPATFKGIDDTTFYRNYFYQVSTRTPAMTTGVFHVCNNVIDGWNLGFQGHNQARALIESNVLIVRPNWKSCLTWSSGHVVPGGTENDEATFCFKDNHFKGNSSELPMKNGEGRDQLKFGCSFKVPYDHDCPEIDDVDSFIETVKSEAGVGDWCSL